MSTTKNLIKGQLKIFYEELLKMKLFLIELLKALKEDNVKDDEILRGIRKIEELKFEKLNIKFLYDKLWGYWIGDIKKEELYQYLEKVYSQIAEAEKCFNIKEIFSAE